MPDRFERSASCGSSGARIDPDPSAAAGGGPASIGSAGGTNWLARSPLAIEPDR
jgi:hypothetical protein